MTHDHLSSSASSSMVTGNNSSQKSPSPATSPTNGRHPVFRGIRCRSGKWVSEIREPRKTTRIWLGTYPLPEMAAIAYDTAALALKGTEAALNFPESAHLLPVPVSNSPLDIRAAASSAADSISRRVYGNDESKTIETQEDKFVDEEALFDTPQFLMSLAEGLLVSPPRIESPLHYDSPEISQGENLWSYNDRD